MTEQIVNTKIELGDISTKEGVRAERLASMKLTIAHDNLQQIEKQGSLKSIVNSMNAIITPAKLIMAERLKYLTTDTYITGEIPTTSEDGIIPHAHKTAAAAQTIMETIGSDLFSDVALGAMGMEASDLGTELIANAFNPGVGIPDEEIEKFLNGQPNALTDQLNSGAARDTLKKYKDNLSKSRDIPDDEIMSNAVTTTVTADTNPTVTADDVMRGISGTPNARKDRGHHKIEIAGSVSNAERCEGACQGILTRITGCPLTSVTDKKLFKTALEKVYINSQSAAEYFNIKDEPDLAKMKEIESRISEMLLNSIDNKGTQFISVRSGTNNYKAVQLDENEMSPVTERSKPKRENYSDEAQYAADLDKYEQRVADYKAYLETNEKRKAGNEIGRAYAALLSGTADNNELKKCVDMVESAGLKPPGHCADLDKVLSKNLNYIDHICAFTGARNEEEALAMADRIIVDGKRISDMDAYKRASNDFLQSMIISGALRLGLERNLGMDKDKNSWIRPIMLLNEKGEPQPVRFFANEPEMPQKVEKLSGFSRLIASKEKKDADDMAYEQYLKDMKSYEAKKKETESRSKRIDEYNAEADALKYEMVKRNVGIIPTVRQTNLNSISNRSSVSNNSPRLTQPNNTNERTMNQPNRNVHSV